MMFKKENPRDEIIGCITDGYFEMEMEAYNEIEQVIKSELDDVVYVQNEDFIRDWIRDNISIEYPYDHFLNQDVYLDIIVDSGDANYEFVLNNLFNFYRNDDEPIGGNAESSLLWLMRQQGYTNEVITEFVVNWNSQGSRFLESIKEESQNTSSWMNTLAFFVRVTLCDALDLHEKLQSPEGKQGFIIIDNNATCGLYDPWQGAGGLLQIQLERDVELPLKLIDSALPDGCRGYSVTAIYGADGSLWSDYSIRIAEQAA
jgi:hypothetical protein